MQNVIPKTIFLFAVACSAILAQNYESSNLPIIIIATRDIEIVDEPKVMVDMGIIYNGPGELNYFNDRFNEYDGKIGIEFRGRLQQSYRKKSYAIELWDLDEEAVVASLLGLPEESDWVLNASHLDKSLLRNDLAYKIWRELGYWTSRTRYFELVLNEDYRGVYIFMERIKRDANRVNIARLNPDEIEGNDLTGGYIIMLDWRDEDDQDNGWYSEFDTQAGSPLVLQYYYPKFTNIAQEQETFIQAYVNSFEEAVFDSSYRNQAGQRYSDLIDVITFVDQLIINELSRNVDGYKLSTYMYKDRINDGGRFRAGPIWDFDLAFYNATYAGGADIEGWTYLEESGAQYMPMWWERFMADSSFTNLLRHRWDNLRQDVLNLDSLFSYIDYMAEYLDEAQTRNFERWDVLGVDLFYQPEPIPESYEGEVAVLKEWLTDRIEWLDDNIPGEYSDHEIVINEINYNSSDDFNPGDWFELYNPADIEFDLSGWTVRDNIDDHSFILPDSSVIGAEEYLVICRDVDSFADLFPDVDNYLGGLDFGLSSTGDAVRLYDDEGLIVDVVYFDDASPWVEEPDGEGPTLELKNPSYDNSLPEHWAASPRNGSPGARNYSYVFVKERAEKIHTFKLNVPHPNPFNSTTNIGYELHHSSNISLNVYNILGHRVTTLYHGYRQAGFHSASLKATGLPSGLYLIRLEAAGVTAIQKVILIR